MSFHFDETDVRKALELLSRESKLQLLVSPNVTGKISGNVQALTPAEALDAIVSLCHLVVRRDKNLTYIYPPDEVRPAETKPTSLATRVYHLQHAEVKDVGAVIEPFLSASGKLIARPVRDSSTQDPTLAVTDGLPSGADVLVVRDDEITLTAVDQIVTELDIPPTRPRREPPVARAASPDSIVQASQLIPVPNGEPTGNSTNSPSTTTQPGLLRVLEALLILPRKDSPPLE